MRFPTAKGTPRDKDNARAKVFVPTLERAAGLLAGRDMPPLPEGLSHHKLRHTFCSLLFALGRDAPYVMAQLGHAHPAFTLRVYAHVMRRGDGERERLRALVEGRDWAPMGTRGGLGPAAAPAGAAGGASDSAL